MSWLGGLSWPAPRETRYSLVRGHGYRWGGTIISIYLIYCGSTSISTCTVTTCLHYSLPSHWLIHPPLPMQCQCLAAIAHSIATQAGLPVTEAPNEQSHRYLHPTEPHSSSMRALIHVSPVRSGRALFPRKLWSRSDLMGASEIQSLIGISSLNTTDKLLYCTYTPAGFPRGKPRLQLHSFALCFPLHTTAAVS